MHWKNLPKMFSRALFGARAAAIPVAFDGVVLMTAEPKTFSTGSLGWNAMAKKQMKIGECMVWVQMGVQITVIGSKDLPQEGPNGMLLPAHLTEEATS